jgi:IclR family acetate operon transcriptional repressor
MGIKTADRILDVVELFARERRPLSLSEIAERIGVPVSSAHGLVKTLQERSYLYEISRKQGYFPTKKLALLVESITRAMPLLDTFEPHLLQLREITNETVVLGKQQGDSVIYLDVFECNQTVRFSPVIGEAKPLHSTASGKAILASLPPGEFEKFLQRVALEPRTTNTITDAEQLRHEIAAGRRRGWFSIEAENIPDLMAVSASVQIGDQFYVIAIGGPVQRFKPLAEEHAKQLLITCNDITAKSI